MEQREACNVREKLVGALEQPEYATALSKIIHESTAFKRILTLMSGFVGSPDETRFRALLPSRKGDAAEE